MKKVEFSFILIMEAVFLAVDLRKALVLWLCIAGVGLGICGLQRWGVDGL